MGKPLTEKNTNGELVHYSVGALIKSREGRILLVDRKKIPYGLAGIAGHIDEGEESLEALRREVKEESGMELLRVKLLEELMLENNLCSRGVANHYWYFYECECRGTPRLKEDEAHSIAWYSQSELRELFKQGKLEPAWEFWFKRFALLNTNIEDEKESTEKKQGGLGLPPDKLKGVCKKDDPKGHCNFLTMTSGGKPEKVIWLCEKGTAMGEAIKECYNRDKKKFRNNCDDEE